MASEKKLRQTWEKEGSIFTVGGRKCINAYHRHRQEGGDQVRGKQVHGRPLRATFSWHPQGQTLRRISNANLSRRAAFKSTDANRAIEDRSGRDPVPSCSLHNRDNADPIHGWTIGRVYPAFAIIGCEYLAKNFAASAACVEVQITLRNRFDEVRSVS